ncbi:hypothetical protein BD311DRAFT_38949 [Dichomitus squalens]|uniref:Uncharacterized protein n=1 Tax=Dichomitus squalens TaxID=114155 RepID=A0A4Q9MAK7_9APHY|nr:hypothetical protein BD311DRAFT_38949 [Dichomitus squalens]
MYSFGKCEKILAPALVLLSVLNSPHVLAAPAVVSLLVPFALPDEAISASFLGDDGQGHSSYALGVGAASGAFTNTATINGTSGKHVGPPRSVHAIDRRLRRCPHCGSDGRTASRRRPHHRH